MTKRGGPSCEFGKGRLTKKQAAMVANNLGLCYMMMGKYGIIPPNQREELLAKVALPGLIRASRLFDPAKARFSTYACAAIRTAIMSYYRNRKRRAGKGHVYRIDDVPVPADKQPLPPARAMCIEVKEMIAELPARSRLVMELRYYQKMTYREIGERIGLSAQAVSQIEKRILNHLRERYGAKEP